MARLPGCGWGAGSWRVSKELVDVTGSGACLAVFGW